MATGHPAWCVDHNPDGEHLSAVERAGWVCVQLVGDDGEQTRVECSTEDGEHVERIDDLETWLQVAAAVELLVHSGCAHDTVARIGSTRLGACLGCGLVVDWRESQ